MTICATCGAETPSGGRFCIECGAPLATTCPRCGTPFQPGQRFCGGCGSPLAATGGSPASPAPPPVPAAVVTPAPRAVDSIAERRLVSVLFADLVGFTPFAAERDAEDVRAMLTRYFDLASDVITRYGGTVEKFIGDAVMAVWGAPMARENDAELAVRAALDLVDAVRTLGPTIQARAGVLTGEAAVTIGAVNQGMVAGDIVNTAARLQSVAVPGTVLVGEPTMRASSSAIAFQPIGGQELKGKESPVPAFRALRVVAEVGGRNRQEGLEAPFVGRDDEMRTLKDLFHATGRDRRVRLLSIVGPAGIGKSRLAWEFSKYSDGLVEGIWWHTGRSPAYGSGIAFWALGEMVRARCGLRESDDERTTRTQVAATVAKHVPDAQERAWIEPALLALLGVGDRGANPEGLFAAWRTFFERLAASDPVVMLFEDLHWADAGTLDFIDHVLDWTRDLPILIVTLARPELLERRPSWGAGRRHFTSLFLEPLSTEAMRQLLAGLVPGLPESAIRSIVARADGIPLYAVETVRSLLAEGRLVERDGRYEPVGDLSELAVPDTLTALIASRLDGLDPVDRSLLQDAAVLGQSFALAALSTLSDIPADELEPRLRGLVRREILVLQADPRSPERGQYAFVQALIREVAYNTLSKKDRKAKHLAAARWFESIGSDELAGALARHYLAAWQATPEGPEADALAGQARQALVAAADRSMTLLAHDQAIELLADALLVTMDPAERGVLLERQCDAYLFRSRLDDMERAARAALELAITADDGLAEARAARQLGRALITAKRTGEALAVLQSADARVGHLAPHEDVLRMRLASAVALRYQGRSPETLALLEELLVPAERIGDRALVLEMLQARGSALCEVGRVVEGLVMLDGVVRTAGDLGLEAIAPLARGQLAVWSMDIDPRAALAATRTQVEYLRRVANRPAMATNIANGAEIAIGAGEWDWAAAQLTDLLQDEGSPVDWLQVTEQLVILRALRGEDTAELVSQARRIAGDRPELLQLLDDRLAHVAWVAGDLGEARAIWRRYAEWSFLNSTAALPRAGRAALWASDVVGARADLEATIATGLHGAVVDAWLATLRAGIAALEGQAEDARREYRDALARWRELGQDWLEAMTCLDLVLLLGPDDPDAPAAADRAREVFERLGAKPFLVKLDAALAAPGSAGGPTEAATHRQRATAEERIAGSASAGTLRIDP